MNARAESRGSTHTGAGQGTARPPAHPAQDHEDWRHSAACAGTNTDLFFPVGSRPSALAAANHARALCTTCSVRPDCLTYALDTGQEDGIWGGLTENERRNLKGKLA